MIFGTLAASLAAGRILGLDAAGLGHALGMAYHQTSGSAQSMRDGALSKRLGAGFAARAAVLSAYLAKDGLDSTVRTLEGNAGLFALYERGEAEPDRLLDGLGAEWHVPGYSFKPYPGCRCNHTLIGLGLELHQEGIHLDDVAEVELGLSRVNWLSVGGEYDASRDSVVHAQFSASYSFSRAIADGRVDLRSFERPAIGDPRVARFAARVRTVEDSEIDPQAIEPARVRLRMVDGSQRELFSDSMPGSPRKPMTDSEFIAKFNDCLGSGLGQQPSSVRELLDDIGQLEKLRDVRALVRHFPRANARS
jgi:2-methylcitrate dehydratase PrpD